MPELNVDGGVFLFSEDWSVSKYDEWSYFRSVLSRIIDPRGRAMHGCDVLAFRGDEVWIIEAKDYAHPDARAPEELVGIVSEKVVDTLAGLHAGARDSHPNQDMCKRAISAKTLFVVLRLDLPGAQPGQDKMRQEAAFRAMADYRQKLKRVLRRVVNGKIHVVTGREEPAIVPWSVRRDVGERGGQSTDRK